MEFTNDMIEICETAEFLELHGNYYEAFGTLKQLPVEIINNNSNILYLLGNIYQDLRNYEDSITYYKRAIILEPTMCDVWNNIAYSLIELGRKNEALHYVSQELNINPKNTAALINKAGLLDDLHQYDSAIEYINAAIKLKREDDSFYVKGNILRDMGNFEEAIEEYDKAIELCEVEIKLSRILNNKGIALRNVKKYSEAVQCYDKVIALNQENCSAAWNNKGLALFYDEKLNDAKQSFLIAKEMGSTDAIKNLEKFFN